MPTPICFPLEAGLRDARRVVVRPFTPADVDALYSFFRGLPESVKRHAWTRIDKRSVVERWAREIDHEKVVALLALDGRRVVADATIHYRQMGPLRLAGRLKWLLDPEYRGQGLGRVLVNAFLQMARHGGLRHLSCMLMEGVEDDAAETLRSLGFEQYRLQGYGTGPDGRPRDMLKMILEL